MIKATLRAVAVPTIVLLLLLAALRAGYDARIAAWTGMPVRQTIILFAVLGWVAGGGMFVSRLIEHLFWRQIGRQSGKLDPRLLVQITNVLVYFAMGLCMAALLFKVPLTGAIATSSVIGLVIGFAVKSLISDTFSGIARPEAMRFKQLAGIAPEADRVRIEVAAEPADKASLALSTRPVMAALHFLATGVEVPEADLVAGKVRRTVRADGTPFDWQEMLGELFRVRSAASEPDDASTAANYRGTWFYIPDNDLEAKSTFVLMTQIIALHSAPPASIAPLTYSIGK